MIDPIDDFEERIAVIPGKQGFKHAESLEYYVRIGWMLVERGISRKHSLEYLKEIYETTAHEFGK